MTLNYRITLAVTVLISLMTVSILLFVNERVRDSLEDSHRQWSETLSHSLAEATVNNLIEKLPHQVRETLRRTTRSDSRVAYIIITDFQGEVFAHTFDEALPDSLKVDERLVTDESGISVKEVNFRGMEITETSHSLIEGLNAQIRIGIDRAKLGETIKVATKGILFVGAVILLLGITVSIILARRITRPVRSLSEAMQSYAAGDQIQLPEFTKLDSDTKKLFNSFEEMIRLKGQAEKELIDSESNLHSIILNSPVAILIVDSNNDVISCNNKFTNDYGYIQSDISTAEKWWDAAYPDLTYREKVQTEWLTAMEEATRTGTKLEPQTWTITCKDGSKRTAIFDMVNLDQLGVITMVDITEQMKAQKALHESETRFKTLSEGSFEGVVITENGIILDTNQQFSDMIGYPVSELVGKNIIELSAPETIEAVSKMIKEESQEIYEGKAVKKDGTIIDVRSQARHIDYEGRKVRLSAISDITDIKKTEEALQRSSRLAAAGQMASGIAHEINNPLATILACVEVVEKNADAINMESPNGQQLHDYIKLIGEESTRAAAIITDLLDFTRDKPLNAAKFKLCDEVKKTVYLFEVQSRNENYDFQLSFAEKLPSIEGDSSRIRQVLIVLLTNAMEAMPDGGMISVSCEWDRKEKLVVLTVTDKGIGISAEKQKEIFEPFYTSKIEGSGTGLGLSIARDIVEKHNGVIEVKSSRGEGTTFSVKFPCA